MIIPEAYHFENGQKYIEPPMPLPPIPDDWVDE